jgi:hypothetical protein
MGDEETLRRAFVSVEVNADYSQATLTLRDGSLLCFRHRVDERTVRAISSSDSEAAPGLAGQILARVVRFRLNGKHLDVAFADGGRWEMRFPGRS